MPSIWDPRDLLDCDPLGCFTCVGMTKKGARCSNSVNVSDRCEASRLLDRMEQQEPRNVRLSELKDLAELTLCLRWHRSKPGHSQVERVSRDWLKIIQYEYPARAVRDPSPQPRTRIVAVETVSVSSAQLRSATIRRPAVALITPSPSPPRSRTRSASPSPTESRPQTPVPSINSTDQSLLSPPSTQSTTPTPSLRESRIQTPVPTLGSINQSLASIVSRASTASIASTTSTASTTSISTPRLLRSRETIQPRAAPTVGSLQSPPRTPSPAPAVQQPIATQPDPSSPQPAETERRHSRRRPITDPCPICTSDICSEDDAVWCRAECGQSVHRGCFASWRTECLARAETDTRARVTCVYCRATWKWEWEE